MASHQTKIYMAKSLIKSYVALVWVEIKPGVLLRRESIESINEDSLQVRTSSGMQYTFDTKKSFSAFLKKIGINDD